MSHKFPKMYVIRPQFFIPMITLLRNAALNSLEFKKEMQRMQEQEVDVTQFEANLASYTASIENNHRLAGDRFNKAVKEIDDAIAALVKAKEDLLKEIYSQKEENLEKHEQELPQVSDGKEEKQDEEN